MYEHLNNLEEELRVITETVKKQNQHLRQELHQLLRETAAKRKRR